MRIFHEEGIRFYSGSGSIVEYLDFEQMRF